MKITVKRVTSEGIKENEGTLFEAHRYQFCLIEAVEDQMYYAIELSSGLGVGLCTFFGYSKTQAFKKTISFINSKNPEILKIVIKKARRKYSDFYKKYNVIFPVNEPVKHVAQHAKKLDRVKNKE